MSSGPDFIIIGAMKCATSTLHEQLAAQPGIFMSDPKEPCFFSNDPVYARGWSWYVSLFAAAAPGQLRGESSTHYTKLPTYPRTVERIASHLPDVKLIYVMRHPLERLVSQYVHEWTERTIDGSIDAAVRRYPRLVDYGRYAMQLQPYFDAFGRERVLPVFQERLRVCPQEELERVCAFLGYAGSPRWAPERAEANVSTQRLRQSPWRDRLINLPGLKQARRALVPRIVRERIKRLWMMTDRPELSPSLRQELTQLYDADLAELGSWMGVELTCANFKQAAAGAGVAWAETDRTVKR